MIFYFLANLLWLSAMSWRPMRHDNQNVAVAYADNKHVAVTYADNKHVAVAYADNKYVAVAYADNKYVKFFLCR